MREITLNDLKALVDEKVKEGHGAKRVNLSNDDEGNGYQNMYFGLTEVNKDFADEFGLDQEKDIIVG